MKTLVNFQKFSILKNGGFLNVQTKEEVKQWKKLLIQYHFLRGLGVKVSKTNKKYLFKTLTDLQNTENLLVNAIEASQSDEIKNGLKEKIENFKSLMEQLSLMQDEVKTEPIDFKNGLKTMIYFSSIETKYDDEGNILKQVFKTRKGRKFVVKNPTVQNALQSKLDEVNKAIDERKKAEKKEIKKAEKEKAKNDAFVEKVHEKKNLNK